MDLETRLADPRLDPAAQHELLSEQGCLEHLALREEHALVALPALAVGDETGGAIRDAAVEAEHLRQLRRVVVLLGRVLRHEQRVLEPAGRQQPAAEVAEEAEALGLVEPGTGEADGGLPAERAPRVLAAADVESPVDDDVELEPGAGAELE